jgi:hypothetical protein
LKRKDRVAGPFRGSLLASVAPSGVRGPSAEEHAAFGIGFRRPLNRF